MGDVANLQDMRAITTDDVLRMGDVSLDLPIAYLLPCASGPGLCSLVLADFLSCQQNKLLEFCSKLKKLKFSGLENMSAWQIVAYHSVCVYFCKGNVTHTVPTVRAAVMCVYVSLTLKYQQYGQLLCTREDSKMLLLSYIIHIYILAFLCCLSHYKCRFRRTSVPLVKVQPFHMVSYEGEIDSVILTHCRYSLSFGKGQEVEYDFAALEKHIYDRFLVTKPELDRRSQPLMVYTSDIIRRDVFQQLKEKLKPQVSCVNISGS